MLKVFFATSVDEILVLSSFRKSTLDTDKTQLHKSKITKLDYKKGVKCHLCDEGGEEAIAPDGCKNYIPGSCSRNRIFPY